MERNRILTERLVTNRRRVGRIVLIVLLLAFLSVGVVLSLPLSSDESAHASTITTVGSYVDFGYTGSTQTFTTTYAGYYTIECYGAQGGYHASGYAKGGYTKGTIYLPTSFNLYVYVGQEGWAQGNITTSYSFNGGGGFATTSGGSGGGGGGATDVRLNSGSWDDATGLRSRIMVAGGGGGHNDGASTTVNGNGYGHGGGLNGNDGNSYSSSSTVDPTHRGRPGTQTSGGIGDQHITNTAAATMTGSFGKGGQGGICSHDTGHVGGGGGGGYYGGGGSAWHAGGGGGSSFISGMAGCNAVNASGSHTGQSTHYSGYAFYDCSTSAGVREGNGYCKITYVKAVETISSKGGSVTYNASNGGKAFAVTKSGWYTITCAGGAGADGTSGGYGYGATVSGKVFIRKGVTLYVFAGSSGANGGYNGGAGSYDKNGNYLLSNAGGGASDVRLVNGAWDYPAGLISRIIVAGGGGGHNNGASDAGVGTGKGGTTAGANGYAHSSVGSSYTGFGGTQTAGGAPQSNASSRGAASGSFGKGGNGGSRREGSDDHLGGGGGGGWYGGAGSAWHAGGGGGSSYIAGVSGYTGVNENGTSSGSASHYSGYTFTNSTESVGNRAGDGYVTITLTENTVSVTLNNQSATSAGSTSVTPQIDEAMPSITVPTRTGYTFGGYYTGTNGSGTQYLNASGASANTWTSNAGTTLYAKWTANTYNVSYNFAGGTNGSSYPTSAAYDAAKELSAPTRAGYTFAGWKASGSLNADTAKWGTSSSPATALTTSSTVINGATGSVYFKNLSPTASASITFTATWTATASTVSFDANGGSVSTASKSVSFASTYGDLPTPTRTGYTFNGWRILPDTYQQVEYIQTAGAGRIVTNVTPTGNSSLRLSVAQTTVSGNQNYWCARGSSTNTSTWTMFAIGTGYRFDYANTTGANASSISSGTKVVLSAERNRGWLNDSTALSAYGSSSFTAGGPLMFFTSYYGGTGSNLGNYGYMRFYGATFWQAGTLTAYWLPCYRKSDNEMGIYDVKTGSFTAVTGTFTKGNNVYITSSSEFAAGQNVTLYAVWTPNQYTANLYSNYTFTANGSSAVTFDSLGSVTATYAAAMPTITPPVRTGYSFLGYFDKVVGGTKYINANGTSAKNCDFTATKSLYAHWEEQKYTVVFNSNGGTSINGVRYIRDYCSGSTGNQWNHLGEVQAWTTDGRNVANYSVNSAIKYNGNTPSDDNKKAFDGVFNSSYTGGGTVTVDLGAVYDISYIIIQHFPDRIYFKTKVEVSVDGTNWSTVFDSGSTGYQVNGPRLYAEPANGHVVYVRSGDYAAQEIFVGHSENLRTNVVSRTNYDFLGWSTSSTATSATYTNGQAVSGLASAGGTVTLYAVWRGVQKTVTLDNRSATTAGSASITSTYASPLPSITVPTKVGYTFGGYYTEVNGGGTQYIKADGTSAKNSDFTAARTLYAKWTAVQKTITLNNQSATTAGTTSVTATYDSAMPAITVPARTGYTFGGYYTATNGAGTQYYTAAGASARNANFTENTTLFAKWTALVKTVTLNNQSATTAGTTSISATYDAALPAITAPTRTGYDFGGYYTAVNGGGTKYINVDGTSAKNSDFTTDKTLYAKWTAKTYTVSFNGDGGTVSRANLTVTYDVTPSETATATRSGYTFGGFYTAKNGGGTKYFDNNGSAVRAWNIASNQTLYALWTANQYTITLDQALGSGGSTSATATYNATIPDITLPTRTGYVFAGYYTGNNGEGTLYYAANGNGSSSFVYNTVGSVTLHANWTIVEYDVTYELNGGENGNNPAKYTIESANIVFATPTRTGYDFGGWYEESTFATDRAGIAHGSYGDVTVYAKWTPITYTITYNWNDGTATGDPTEYTIESATITFSTPIRSGYDFVGWYAESNFVNEKSSIPTGSYGNVTIYAKWSIVTYTLTYYLNEGTNGANPAGYKVTDSFDLADPTRTGYEFLGWYTENTFATRVYGVALGSTGNREFHALWQIINYSITYHYDELNDPQNPARNDENNPSTFTVLSDFAFGEATRSGFTFVGWYLDEEYTHPIEGVTAGRTGAIEIWAKYTFNAPVVTGDNITATYSGTTRYLTATVSHDILSLCNVTYEWRERGAISEVTTYQHPVRTVAESGDYSVTVTLTYARANAFSMEIQTTKNYTVTITKAPLTIKGVDSSIYYGDAPNYAHTVVGLLGNDNERVISGTVTYNRPYEIGDNPGTYNYTPIISGLTSDNYSIIAQNGVITVRKRAITLTATQLTVGFDGTAKACGYTMSPTDFYGKSQGSVTVTVLNSSNQPETDFVSIGRRTVNLSTTYPSNRFDVTINNGYLEITQAELVLSVTYSAYVFDGEPKAALWRYVSGLAQGDVISGVTITYTENGVPVSSPTEKGDYEVTITDYTLSSGNKNNYHYVPAVGVMKIGAVPIYIDVNSVTEGVTYDGTPKYIDYDYRVIVGDTLTCNLVYSKGGVVGEPIDAGEWTVTVDLDSVVCSGNPEDYSGQIIVTDGVLVIGKKTVSFEIEDDAVTYDGDAHTVGVTAVGLVGNDRAEATLAYSDNVNAGTCAVTVSAGAITSGNPDNYEFDLSAEGTLTIGKRTIVATVVDVTEGVYFDGMRHYTDCTVQNAVSETSFTFELNYSDNVHAGTCDVSINNYYGNALDEQNYDVDVTDTGFLVISKGFYDFSRMEDMLASVGYRFKKEYTGSVLYPAINVLPLGKDGTTPEIFFSRGVTDVAEGEVTIGLTFSSHSDNYVDPENEYEITMYVTPFYTDVIWDYTEYGLQVEYSGGKILPTAYALDVNGEEIPLSIHAEDGFKDVRDDVYEVWAELPETATNYALSYAYEYCTVTPKEITLRFHSARTIYDGTRKSIGVTAVGLIRNESVQLDVNYDREPIAAGIYTATVTLSGSENYVLVGETSTQLEIVKRVAKVIAHDLTSVYGDALVSTVGEYDTEGFIEGDEPVVTVEKEEGLHVGTYFLTPVVESADNYDVRTVKGRYSITPTAITVFIADRSQKSYNSFTLSAKRGTENSGDWYLVSGTIPDGDDPQIELNVIVEAGDTDVPILCTAKNADFDVTFVGKHETKTGDSYAMYHIILEQSYLKLPDGFVNHKVYDGKEYVIPIENTGHGKISAYIKNRLVKNSFTEVGVYEITFKGTAEQKYYAPEDLTVVFTIYPAEVVAESEGVTVKSVDETSGFAVQATISVRPDQTRAAEASSSVDFFKKVTSFYSISVSEGNLGEVLELSVGEEYKDGDVVTVCLYDGNGYVVKEYTVTEGHIIIEDASNVVGVGIVDDDSTKGIFLIIAVVAVAIFLGVAVSLPLIFRGRRRY